MKRFLVAMALGILWPGIVLATESASITPKEAAPLILAAGSDESPSASGEVQNVEQIVVTPTGTEVPIKNTSVSATTVTSQQIDARQATRVEQLLRDVPGIIASQNGGPGRRPPCSSRGGNSNMTQVLLNGFRLNDVGGFFDFSKLTTDNVERVEVVRGPMSSLYGNDAMTGVINIISRWGEGPPSVSLTTNEIS